jgi:hypothetical protein
VNFHTGSLNWSRPSATWHLWSKGPTLRSHWWSLVKIICGMRFCIVDNVLHRGDMLPKNFHWQSHTWNACLPFPEQSNKITLQNQFQMEWVSQHHDGFFP